MRTIFKKFYISSNFIEKSSEYEIVEDALFKLKQVMIHLDTNTKNPSIKDIKDIIKEVDYVVLLIGEEYGTIYNNGVSLIEFVYNYATEINKYIFCLIKNINEENVSYQFNFFRKKVMNNSFVIFWENETDLKNNAFLFFNKSLNTIRDIENILDKNKIKTKDENVMALEKTLELYATEENNDIIALMIDNLRGINQFYELTKYQANNAYRLAKNSSIAGIILIIVAVLIALIFNNNQIAVATTTGGIIVETLAGTSLFVYQKTLKQLNYYYASLHNNERFLSLINIVSKTNIKDELYRKIVESELDNLKQYEIKNDDTQ